MLQDDYKTGNAKMDLLIEKQLAKESPRKRNPLLDQLPLTPEVPIAKVSFFNTIEVEEEPHKKKRHKYGVAHKADRALDGIQFDSKKEMLDYVKLKQEEKAGLITDLQLQVVFTLQEAFIDGMGTAHKPISYKADFTYKRSGVPVIHDSKGMRTDVYMLKKKLLLYRYPQYQFIES